MSFTGSTEYNQMGQGGMGGPFGGMGMGGFGLIGLIGLQDLLRRHGHDGGDGDGGCQREVALLAAINNAKDVSVAEARALATGICEVKDNVKDALYASTIQGMNQTAEIKAQAAAFQIANDAKFDALSAQGTRDTAAILARINDAEVQALRDQLAETRHGLRGKDVEISIQNTNNAIATQLQAQQQQQQQKDFEIHRRFDALFSQVAKSSQDIINVGGLLAGVSQAANPTNVK